MFNNEHRSLLSIFAVVLMWLRKETSISAIKKVVDKTQLLAAYAVTLFTENQNVNVFDKGYFVYCNIIIGKNKVFYNHRRHLAPICFYEFDKKNS